MALNRSNPALNKDMQGVLERMAAQIKSGAQQPPPAGAQPGQILLNAYTKSLS
jgi:hypothetical protein